MSQETKEVVLKGRVITGVGEGQYFTTLDWVRQQFLDKFGFEPVPGTFNVKVAAEGVPELETLNGSYPGVEIVPPNPEFCLAKCFRVRVGAVDGVLVTPMVEGYPKDLVEIMAPVNVRQALGVGDDDAVEVRVRVASTEASAKGAKSGKA